MFGQCPHRGEFDPVRVGRWYNLGAEGLSGDGDLGLDPSAGGGESEDEADHEL